jgi:3-hydroxyisobutyrate dehydrogenase-like beta-hydroxyacid dehydrogenase
MSEKPRLGYIGIGNMGEPMALRLLDAGYVVNVWGRTRSKLAAVIEKGAVSCASPGELAQRSDIVFTCVLDTAAVGEVVLGKGGVAEGGGQTKILVDMSTIAPAATVEMAGELSRRCGMAWVDAPVSGGTVGARAGTLAVMAGGDEAVLDSLRPVLSHLARNVTRMGPIGAGQKTKLINQTIVAGTLAILSEALVLAEESGVDATALPAALAGGRADSTMLQQLLPGMAVRDYTLTSPLHSMIKDLDMVQALAREAGAPMPVTGLIAELYRLAAHHQHAQDDVTAYHKIFSNTPLD